MALYRHTLMRWRHARHDGSYDGWGIVRRTCHPHPLVHPRRHIPVHERLIAAGCMSPTGTDTPVTAHGRSALPTPLAGVGPQFGLPPGPALPGVRRQWTSPRLPGGIRLPARLPEVPPQHAISTGAAPGGPGVPGHGM